MNNEEKILSMLETMQGDLSGIKTDVAELKTDVAELKTDVAELKTDVAVLKTDVAVLKTDVSKLEQGLHDTNLKIELIIEPRLDSFAAGQGLIREKLDEHSEALARLEQKVDDLDVKVGAHDYAIRTLRA